MDRLLSSSMVGLMATSSKRDYSTGCVTQVAAPRALSPWQATADPCLSRRHSNTGLVQTLKHRSGSDTQTQVWFRRHSNTGLVQSLGSLGPGSKHKVLFEPSECLWQEWGVTLNMILSLLPSCRGFFFTLGCAVSSLGGIQHLLSMVVQQWVVILEFSQEKMSACPSSPPVSFMI